MTKSLLGLVMIVKDEAKRIRETLESVHGIVDRWTILDTGSTDGTQNIIRESTVNVPGALFEELFVDFSTSRNRVLGLSAEGGVGAGEPGARGWWFEQPPTFTLMLSGDEVLHGGDALRKFLEEHRDSPDGAYSIEMRSGGSRWFYPRILRTGAGWRYVGKVHEVPVGPGGETHGPVVPVVYIQHTVSDPERRSRRMREFDLPVLQAEVDDNSKTLEERAQAIWFLAQTHEAVADDTARVPGGSWISHKFAAMSLYKRRAELGGVDELKTHYAVFRYLNAAEQAGVYGHEELLKRLELLLEVEQRIPEVGYMAAVHAAALDVRRGALLAETAAKSAREAMERPSTHLPVDSRVEWLSLRLAAACAKELKNERRARQLAERGLAAGGPREAFEEFLK